MNSIAEIKNTLEWINNKTRGSRMDRQSGGQDNGKQSTGENEQERE